MKPQPMSDPQPSDQAAEASQRKKVWVSRIEIDTHTHDVSLPVNKRLKPSRLSRPLHTTLLDLVCAVNEVIDDEQLVVATVAHLINTHQVRLTGNFKNTTLVIV